MKLLNTFIMFLLLSSVVDAKMLKNSVNTIKDTKTNYIWQDTKETRTLKMNFHQAIDYCQSLEVDGLKSWKLPGFVELFSIIDTRAYNPSISKQFQNIVPKDYWISKKFGNGSSKEAFVVNFVNGAFNRQNMENLSFVRCYKR